MMMMISTSNNRSRDLPVMIGLICLMFCMGSAESHNITTFQCPSGIVSISFAAIQFNGTEHESAEYGLLECRKTSENGTQDVVLDLTRENTHLKLTVRMNITANTYNLHQIEYIQDTAGTYHTDHVQMNLIKGDSLTTEQYYSCGTFIAHTCNIDQKPEQSCDKVDLIIKDFVMLWAKQGNSNKDSMGQMKCLITDNGSILPYVVGGIVGGVAVAMLIVYFIFRRR